MNISNSEQPRRKNRLRYHADGDDVDPLIQNARQNRRKAADYLGGSSNIAIAIPEGLPAMTEAKQSTASMEKFEFKWSTTAKSEKPAEASISASLPPFEPIEYSVESVVQVEAPLEVVEEALPEPMATVEPSHRMESYPPVDEGSLGSFRSSPKFGKRLSLPSLPSIQPKMKLRIAGVGAWSAVAGVGAGEIVINAGSTFLPKLGILGGVWGAITVAIWFLSGKLSK